MPSQDHGGALQLAALRGTLGASHPALAALPPTPAFFSSNALGPLYLAAGRGHAAVAEVLLAAGADPLAGNGGLMGVGWGGWGLGVWGLEVACG